MLKYELSKNDWKTKLQTKIIHLRKTKDSILKSVIEQNKFNIGVICALPEEFLQVKEVFGKNEWTKYNNTEHPFDLFSTTIVTGYGNSLKVIAGCVGKPGISATSIMSATLYNLYKIDYLFMTGFCAGFESDDLDFGDIVVSESIQDYSVGKIIEDKTGNVSLLKELQQIPANYELITKINTFISNGENIDKVNRSLRKVNLIDTRKNSKALIGPTVCGPFVVTSEIVMAEIKKDSRKLKSLDMEGFGLYLTSHILNKKCLWIKAIADFANSSKGDEYHDRCSYGSAIFLYHFIKESF